MSLNEPEVSVIDPPLPTKIVVAGPPDVVAIVTSPRLMVDVARET